MIRSDNNKKLISDSKSATLNTPKYTFLLFACDYLGWSPDCSGLPFVKTVKALLFVTVNFDMTCMEMHKMLSGNMKLLEYVHSGEKYKRFEQE